LIETDRFDDPDAIERVGLEPDVSVKQNAKDLAQGTDTVLDAVREYLRKYSLPSCRDELDSCEGSHHKSRECFLVSVCNQTRFCGSKIVHGGRNGQSACTITGLKGTVEMDLRFLTGKKMTFAIALLALPALLTGCGSLGAGATIASDTPPVVSALPSDSFDESSRPPYAAVSETISDGKLAAPEPVQAERVSLETTQSVVERSTERPVAPKSQTTPRRVEHVDDRSFQEKVLDSDEAVLVDFYADWCGPCKKLSPVLDVLAKEASGVRIVKLNIDRSPELATDYRVDSIPTLILFKDGKPVARRGGLIGKDSLRELIKQP